MSPEELENQIRILSRILDETTAEKINLNNSYQVLVRQFYDLKQENDELKQDLAQISDETSVTIDGLGSELALLEKQYNELEDAKNNLESENTKLQNALAEAQAMNNKDE